MARKSKTEKGVFRFDEDKEEYVDMVGAGIIDPTRMVRLAFWHYRMRPASLLP